jgi:TRAP-type C4-dicarboxylate transport system substrate-binding protein
MEAQVFPSSLMGTKDQIIDQMLAGMAAITLADGAFFADRGAPDMGITMGPFFFATWDEAWNMVESNWWANQARILEGRGLKILASNWKYGERHTLTTRPIRAVEDFRGLLLRVPTNLIQIRGTEVLGATPTPLPLGEVYTALQQGVFDGVENPLAVLWGGRFHEIAKYLTLTSHIRLITAWFTGTQWFNSLSAEHQRILIETGNEAGLHNNQLVDRAELSLIDDLRREGVEIIDIDIPSLQRQAAPFYTLPDFTAIWSAGIIEATNRAKAGQDRAPR